MHIKPVIFQEGQGFYDNLADTFIRHKKGLFILAPSGAGKTYYCNNQIEKHWIDGDELWTAAGAHPDGPWWKESIEVMDRIDMRADLVTMEAMHEGFWIMGLASYWLKPDAIVVPDWETLTANIQKRQSGSGYDGGATSEDFAQVKTSIMHMSRWQESHGVPIYASIDEAASRLTADVA